MMDAGVISVCELINTASQGNMPHEELSVVNTAYYEDRLVGYGRYFAALGVNEQVDLTVRVWRMAEARAGMYAILEQSENDGQYRIVQVQHLQNDDGLKVTDISLSRLNTNYEVKEHTPDDELPK